MNDLISRQAAITLPVFPKEYREYQTSNLDDAYEQGWMDCQEFIADLPSAEPEKEKPRRVLWTGWKGYRDTRYKCPLCNKPVKNDDVYCHRCGQKLMFPKVDWTPYVEGQKQELIVRWDDE